MSHQPRKRFGQHFLHEKIIVQRIIDAIAPDKKTPIVEIGPGLGALTIPLLKYTGKLDAVEVDHDLANKLLKKCNALGDLQMHIKDVLDFNFNSLSTQKIKIVGNLPYSISTPLLFYLLSCIDSIEEMIFMMQKEVVERICAEVNTRSYGRLTVMLQSKCYVENLFSVGPDAFTPPPKVESSVVRLRPLDFQDRYIENEFLFADVVKQAFAQRRKMLRNSLKNLINEASLQRLGIAPSSRAENLTVDDYVLLANAIHEKNN